MDSHDHVVRHGVPGQALGQRPAGRDHPLAVPGGHRLRLVLQAPQDRGPARQHVAGDVGDLHRFQPRRAHLVPVLLQREDGAEHEQPPQRVGQGGGFGAGAGAGVVVFDGEHPAGAQHPAGLLVGRLAWQVDERVDGHGRVEGQRRERQVQRVRLDEPHLPAESFVTGQRAGLGHLPGRGGNPGDLGPGGPGQPDRGQPETASDVEDPLAAGHGKPGDDLACQPLLSRPEVAVAGWIGPVSIGPVSGVQVGAQGQGQQVLRAGVVEVADFPDTRA